MNETPQKAWICSVCGYVHYGPEPPAECPVCGADSTYFSLLPDDEPTEKQTSSKMGGMTVIIAGAGIAGISAAEELRKINPEVEIILLSNENVLPYYRINLTRYLAGEITPEQFDLHPASWYASRNITLLLNVEVAAIDPNLKTITLDNGKGLDYDRLLLTTGARPFIPPIPGAQLKMVHSLRTRKDADFILGNCKGKNVVCIGGGLLGLETASALVRQGARVTVLESLDWLIPRQLNKKAAEIFQNFVEQTGIAVKTSVKIKELIGNEKVESIILEDGTKHPADMVIISAGVRSNISLAVQAGLKVNQGIMVDHLMRTSQPDIFAAGDATEHEGVLYGTWSPALAQGIIAGSAAAGKNEPFQPLPRSVVLKVLGIDLFSAGKIAPGDGDRLIEETGKDSYLGFVFQDGALIGSILLGDTSASAETKKAIDNHLDCSALLTNNPNARQVLDFIKNQSV